MINSSNNTSRIGAPAYTESAAPLRNTPSTPPSEAQPPVANPPAQAPESAPAEAPSTTDEVRKLGVSESSPVKVSFQTPASASANAIQGVRRLNASEDIMALPDLPAPDMLEEAVGYYQSALSAVQEGALDIAQDFLAWARELDPGAPDLP
mgnify:CR=1 FL=1